MSHSVQEQLRTLTSLHALTEQGPWGELIASGKDVENRTWPPPKGRVGGLLASHQGQAYDASGAQSVREVLGLEVPSKDTFRRGVVVAVTRLAAVVRDSTSSWAAEGQYHWCLEGTVALPLPVPCKGAQGLWALPPQVFAQVRAQLLGGEGPPAAPGPAPRCPCCDTIMVRCGACGTWWRKGGGHLIHRCEADWPRCQHQRPYWETSAGRRVPPECCRPKDWWAEVLREGASP